MKKTAFLLVLVIILSLCGCGDKKETKKELEVDIEYYAKLGQMPECEFKLGDSIEVFDEHIENSSELGHTHDINTVCYELVENDDYTAVYAGSNQYYFGNKNKDKGIGVLVSFDGAYGFEAGSVSVEIAEELASAGYEAELRDAEEEDAFFLSSVTDFTCLEYEFSGKTVKFIFEENELCACSLSSEDWSL